MHIATSKVKFVLSGLGFIFLLTAMLVSCLNTGTNTEIVYKYDKYLEAPPDIRVLLQKDVKEAEIEISHPYSISDLSTNKILASKTNLPKSVIFLKSGEFRTKPRAAHTTSEASITFVKTNSNVGIVSNNGFIKIDKSKYRGKLILVPQNKDRFTVLEEIGIEEYLPGVVEGEMPTMWREEAIQAQAIAARTYAIYQKKNKNDALYHINKLDLAYNGSYNYQAKTKEIVDKSRGTVMVYNWELFPGYFHSTCGGHTEDINIVFNLKSIPPLSGTDCGYCNKSRYYNWKTNLKKDEIERKLTNAKLNVQKINRIVTEKTGPGGHSSIIKIEHSGGTKRVNANEFRLIVGPNNLRSTAFKVKNNGSSLAFDGNGWGHGVGLCQYGTQGMAKSGFKWYDILKHYYPEMDLVKIY